MVWWGGGLAIFLNVFTFYIHKSFVLTRMFEVLAQIKDTNKKEDITMSNVNGAGNDYVYYGGVRFNKNEVQSSKVKNGNEYEVKLKTGQTIFYKDQMSSDRNVTNRSTKFDPSVIASTEDGIAVLMGADLSGVTVIGNPNKKDYISIDGDNNKVFVDNDNYADEVHTSDPLAPFNSADSNRVALGNNDTWVDNRFIELSQDKNGKLSTKHHLKY